MTFAALKGPGEVAAEVLMSRSAFGGSFLIVEGDGDSRFFRGRIDAGSCEIVIGGGKQAVEGGIERLDRVAFRGAIGVCDDDCASLQGTAPASANLVVTECRDLDTLLVRSPALERLLAEYGDPVSVAKFAAANGSVRDGLLGAALPFGRLRWLAVRDGLALDFKQLRPFRFVKANWAFNPSDLTLAAAAQIKVDPLDLAAQVAALPAADPWLLCQGHDLLALLAIALDKGGILGAHSPHSDVVASCLRAALDDQHWSACRLAQNIRAWEAANPPFRVRQ